MLSTVAIISIFAEIFACGILLSGAFAFIKRFLRGRQNKDLVLSLLFLSFFAFVGLMLASELLYNLGKPIENIIFLQKLIAFDLVTGSFLVFLFIKTKFEVPYMDWFILAYVAASAAAIYRLGTSSVNLVYSFSVVEPIVTFSNPSPYRSIWMLSWAVLFVFSAYRYLKNAGPRPLLFCDAFASLLFISSYLSTISYSVSSSGNFLLASWVMTLIGALFLILAEIIPETSDLAKNPFNFFRSRLLFKLIFIFVLLIVILFEATTLATLTLSKQALQSSIFSSYKEAALGISQRIQNSQEFNIASADKIIRETRVGRAGIAYVVSKDGILLAHPDPAYAGARPDLSKLEQVRLALSGKTGFGQFKPDEWNEIKVGAYSPVKKFGGAVIVEEPLVSAYYEMRQLETNSLLFVIAGILLTVLTGLFLAQSIEVPIHKLNLGTEEISHGNLNHRINIDSIDEIGKLAAAFNKMTHDLKESQDRLILSEKLASLGTMAAGMAHEIKNPLVSLRIFSQLLEQKWEDKEFRDKFAQIVPTEIERINKIAESLLKFGRPMKPEMGRVDVNSIIEEILILFESEAKKNGIRITKKFAGIPEVSGDMQQLSQAFVNIILNGIQAMEKGGELIIKTDIGEVVHLGQIKQGIVKEDGTVVWGEEEKDKEPIKVVFIEITDTGPGITRDHLKSLFDPFFTTKAKGTGMGLPITLRIIEEHKGSIKVKSEVGKGTTFLITLPQQ
ncbi:HAMP domain-containing protein [Candidatus Saganbacteria bacterium]|nr:HAMP domain-containing protein [Candidatus Saganbacteria bacterium]